jgi:hypothetical protein
LENWLPLSYNDLTREIAAPSRSPLLAGILQPVFWGAAEVLSGSSQALTAAQRRNRKVQEASSLQSAELIALYGFRVASLESLLREAKTADF